MLRHQHCPAWRDDSLQIAGIWQGILILGLNRAHRSSAPCTAAAGEAVSCDVGSTLGPTHPHSSCVWGFFQHLLLMVGAKADAWSFLPQKPPAVVELLNERSLSTDDLKSSGE